MAKKKAAASAPNVSELIRKTWDEDQTRKPAAIVEALKARGIETNPGTVATTLSLYRKKLGLAPLRGGKKGRKKAVAAADSRGVQVGNGRSGGGRGRGGKGRMDSATGSVASVIEALKLVTKAKELVGAEGLREIVKAV